MAKDLSRPAPEQGVAEGFSCKQSDSKRVQFACLHVSSATEHQTSTDGMEANGYAVLQGPAMELSGGGLQGSEFNFCQISPLPPGTAQVAG